MRDSSLSIYASEIHQRDTIIENFEIIDGNKIREMIDESEPIHFDSGHSKNDISK